MKYLVKFTHNVPVKAGFPRSWIDGYRTARQAKAAVQLVEDHKAKHGSAPWEAEYLGKGKE